MEKRDANNVTITGFDFVLKKCNWQCVDQATEDSSSSVAIWSCPGQDVAAPAITDEDEIVDGSHPQPSLPLTALTLLLVFFSIRFPILPFSLTHTAPLRSLIIS